MVTAAFAAHKGDPPHLTEVPTPSTGGSSYYALELEDTTPAALKPFSEVQDQVRADWTADAIHKEQETAAAALLAAVKGGETLSDAAARSGLTTTRSPLTGRAEPTPGVPGELLPSLFATKQGEPTMVARRTASWSRFRRWWSIRTPRPIRSASGGCARRFHAQWATMSNSLTCAPCGSGCGLP